MKYTDKVSGLQEIFDEKDLLHRITNRIRQSLELKEILAATVRDLRAFLGTDRVKVYKFDTDSSGEVIAEAIHEKRLPSLLGLHFPAEDIPKEAREMFLSVGQRTIVDVSGGRIGLSPQKFPQNGKPLQIDNIQYRRVDPCHIEYLTAMGVQSSLVVPILESDHKDESAKPRLWGLLVTHHSEPRTFLKREIRVVQQVADELSLAIALNNLVTQARKEQQQEAIINRVITLLHSLPTIQLQAALEETIAAFGGAGGRLYIEPTKQIYTWGDQPSLPYELENSPIEEHPVWQNWVAGCKQGSVLAIADLYQQPQLRVLALGFQSTRIRGLLVIPLHYRQKNLGFLSIFRNEYDTEKLWAGRCDHNQRQLLPRLSFELWREQKKGQAPEWKPEDISLAQTLCHHFSTAIQQQLMYRQVKKMCQQVQALNLNLESKVQLQTTELQKSLQLSKVLKQITDQIRSTLDSKTILRTIVREVRQLLNTDRVLIYQLLDTTDGEVIYEEVNGNWKSVLGMKAPSECFPDEYANLYFRGRVRAIDNVLAASLSACHQKFLENMQVQAYLVVPIKMGTQLWGLLIAHECQAPRKWHDDEIDLLQQLGDQAAIAIQQAELYEQSRTAETEAKAKATQLEQTLQQLQQAQAQLIQTEKMSSLGELVAGVAHEINNPVSFIYGNLCHAMNYTNELLELLHIYQTEYPQPNEQIDAKTEVIDLDFVIDDLPKIMTSMQVGAERIRTIVLSLRNFSRLDQAEMKPVDLHEGIDNTLLILQHRLKPNANFPGIEVIKDYGDLPLVECYAGQMNQVFMNILGNAIDAFTEEKETEANKKNFPPSLPLVVPPSSLTSSPRIYIFTSVSADNSRAVICIADNGLGMSEEVKKRIFDPFFTTKPVGKGTGLGLAISYQIVVKKHGGEIKCVSKLGEGTEFWIEIPLKQSICSYSND